MSYNAKKEMVVAVILCRKCHVIAPLLLLHSLSVFKHFIVFIFFMFPRNPLMRSTSLTVRSSSLC